MSWRQKLLCNLAQPYILVDAGNILYVSSTDWVTERELQERVHSIFPERWSSWDIVRFRLGLGYLVAHGHLEQQRFSAKHHDELRYRQAGRTE